MRWHLPERFANVITTIDAHAAGEPLRIITSGLPDLPGGTILERRRYMQTHLDDVRKILMWEPRGHYDMYGCVLTPPVSSEANFGVLFLHNEGYSTMCGHGVIAVVTALVECGIVQPTETSAHINLDTPAGLVRATAHVRGSRVRKVTFLNVPSFVYAKDVDIHVPGIGSVRTDVSFGGAFYAILPAERVGLRVEPAQRAALVELGGAVKRAVNAALEIRHPNEADLGFLYGTIFTDKPEDPEHHSRNVCVFANAEVDRSPTGTGVSARVAMLAATGELADGDEIAIESILGRNSVFTGRIASRTSVGAFSAVIPEVGGTAYLTGSHQFVVDERDPLSPGFLVA